MKKHHNYCILLAGGVGKRLWPLSRRNMPKQFLDFFGTGRTLIQQTYERMARFIPTENIYISTFADYEPMVKEQLPDVSPDNILSEPVQLSTAPATVWASYHISLRDPEANILVTPCDQLISDEATFISEMEAGLDFVANHNAMLAMGVKAQCANSAYGYIQMGQEKRKDLFAVKSFTEKPDLDYAQKFVDSGEFLWNTGLYLWNASTIVLTLHTLMPEIDALIKKEGPTFSQESEIRLVRQFYPTNYHRSIDLVVLDKCENVFVQSCRFGWADIGCWPELHRAASKDVDGNAVLGQPQVFFAGSQDNLVYLPAEKRAVIRGLDGFLVAEHGDVLVICPNDDHALVKKLFKEAEIVLGEKYV